MTAIFYYFTGTGNSLHVARSLAKALGDCTLISLAGDSALPTPGTGVDTVGFTFPVHFWDMPALVRDRVRQLRIDGNPYVFAAITCDGGPGRTLFSLAKLLKEKGQSLAAGYSVNMPDSCYAMVNLITPPEQRAPILETAEARLAELAGAIRRKERPGITTPGSPVYGPGSVLMKTMATKGYRMQRRYRADERCNACGICQRICPTGNITVEGGKVTWGDRCAQCQACFHWCPKQAIQLDKKTPAIARYHHPQIGLKDMLLR